MYYKPSVDIQIYSILYRQIVHIHAYTQYTFVIYIYFFYFFQPYQIGFSSCILIYSSSCRTTESPVLFPRISENLQKVLYITSLLVSTGHVLQDSPPITPGLLIMAFPAGCHSTIYLTVKCENLLPITQDTSDLRLQFQQTL